MGTSCPPFEPFKCRAEAKCISIQYLCDGADDCEDGYDEDPRLCTAARRPPVEETANFIYSLLMTHGANHLERFLGHKARNGLKAMGGIDKVAISLSESPTIEDFGNEVGMTRQEVDNLRLILFGVDQGDIALNKGMWYLSKKKKLFCL